MIFIVLILLTILTFQKLFIYLAACFLAVTRGLLVTVYEPQLNKGL